MRLACLHVNTFFLVKIPVLYISSANRLKSTEVINRICKKKSLDCLFSVCLLEIFKTLKI